MDGRLLLLGWGLVLAACATGPSPAPAPTPILLALPPATATGEAAPVVTRGVAATPVIIASPTASATPVTHVVQKGETMLGVAIDFGVSLDALQAANPTVEPRFLSIGTVLIIPPPESGFASAATNLAPPPPAAVNLSQPVCYSLPSDGLYCFVEAHNPNDKPIQDVSARIILAGADGLPFAEQTVFGALDMVPAGAAVPLGALFAPAPTHTVAATAVELLGASLVAGAGANARGVMLSVTANPGVLSGGRWTVSGQVRNPISQAFASAWVLLTVYDSTGRVGGFRKLSLANGLGASETRDFTISCSSLAGPVDHTLILAEGRP